MSMIPKNLAFSTLITDLEPVLSPSPAKGSNLPPLSNEALQGLAGEVVAACTKDSEATEAGVLFYFLQRFGCQIGPFAHVLVGEEKHYARLNVVLVGKSSRARKGTSMRPVDSLFEAVNKVAGLSLAAVRNSSLSSGEGLVAAVRDDSVEQDKDGNPLHPGVSDKRCLMVSEEFASALTAMKRQGNNLSAIIRSLWDIGNVDVVTKGDPIKTTGAHVCLMSHITEPELLEMLENRELFNGFANRFLWVRVERSKIIARPKQIPVQVKTDLAQRIATACVFAGSEKEFNLSNEAENYWQDLYERLADDSAKNPAHDGATSRAEPYILRMAMIYAALDLSHNIELQHLRSAEACWNYCDASARQIFARDTSLKFNQQKAKLLEFLAGGERSLTEIHNLFGRNMPAGELTEQIRKLESEGAITSREEKLETGKPRRFYKLSKLE